MVVAGRLRGSVARRVVDGDLVAAGDVERDGEDGGDRARVSFGHGDIVDGEGGERRVGLQRSDSRDYEPCRRRCGLVAGGAGCQWRGKTNDDEDRREDAIHRPRKQRGGAARP